MYYWKHHCKSSKTFVYISDQTDCWNCGVKQSGPLTQMYQDSEGRHVKVTVDFHDEIHESHPLSGIKVLDFSDKI